MGAVTMSARITQRELEAYLWGAAVVLRGLIDAGDYKQYIFPLVFLKRISDVYDEEHAAAMGVYGDEELAGLPENYRFAIPDGCHWDDIRSVNRDVGGTVLKAMRAIESANPDTLPGVFGDGDWPTCRRMSWATAMSSSSRSSPTTAATRRRSSTPTAPLST